MGFVVAPDAGVGCDEGLSPLFDSDLLAELELAELDALELLDDFDWLFSVFFLAEELSCCFEEDEEEPDSCFDLSAFESDPDELEELEEPDDEEELELLPLLLDFLDFDELESEPELLDEDLLFLLELDEDSLEALSPLLCFLC